MRTAVRGVSLIDTIVGTALMLVVFLGIGAAFRLSVEVITNNKARAGAIALANERMEYLRSLSYSELGTSGGIPTGTLAQNETQTLNGVPYARRTLIVYQDDPKDGTGGSDANHITADYKLAKVDVTWQDRTGQTRHITIASRFSPTGIETAVPGGTLVVNAVSAAGAPLTGATVHMLNASSTPAVDLTMYTDTDGRVTLIGAPAASGYEVTVSEPGYSTAKTYSTTASNTNPTPPNLSVTNDHTTTATLAIDLVGSIAVRTWAPIAASSWTDTFADTTKVASAADTAVSGGALTLAGPPYPGSGTSQSIAIGPSLLSRWKTLSWNATVPAGTLARFQVYDGAGASLIPDAQLPGNSSGFVSSPVDISGVSTSTYPALRTLITLTSSDPDATPSVGSYAIGYEAGPTPLPSLAFSVRGAKTIGSGPSGTLYKYSIATSTDASGSRPLSSLEWDSYAITVDGATGYDVSRSCPPQPVSLAPGAALVQDLFLSPHTANSLLVDVRSGTTSELLSGVEVVLFRSGYAATSTTDTCGQAFFPSLSAAGYSASASSTGYATVVASSTVSGATALELIVN